MVEMNIHSDTVHSFIDLAVDHTSVVSRPLIVLGGGGDGTSKVTGLAGEIIQCHGEIPPNVRLLAFDVMPTPPRITTSRGVSVQLEPGLQYLQIGKGCNPAHLRKRRDEGRLDPELAELVDRQPEGRFAHSLELGSENQRIFGAIALRWSGNEVRRMVTSAVTRIAALQSTSTNGESPSGEAPIVIVAASVAGGVGSSIALPLAAEVKRAMGRLGMDTEASTFIVSLTLPEAFPITRMRYSNAFDTIRDVEAVQKCGRLPSTTLEHGAFDLALLSGPQTESGRNLGNEAELVGVMAKCLFLVGQTPVREALLGATNNMATKLSAVNEDGSPSCWGAPGIVSFHFRGGPVATHFANVAGERVIAKWADADAIDGLGDLLKDARNRHKLNDINSYMSFVYDAAEGEESLGDFVREAADHLRAEKARAKDLELELARLSKGFGARLHRVVAQSRSRADLVASAFAEDVRDEAVTFVDDAGPMSGSQFINIAMDFLGGLRDQLESQRAAITKDVQSKEAALAAASGTLKDAASRSRSGRLAGLREPLDAYLESAKQQFMAKHGLEVTTIALAAISEARKKLAVLQKEIEGLRSAMKAAARLCGNRRRDFESAPVTLVSEMIDRPIYNDTDLKALYSWACKADWTDLSQETEAAIRQKAGGLSAWLSVSGDDIAAGFVDHCLPVFQPVRDMSADEFVRWRHDVLGQSPASFFRDALALASPLARFDRTVATPDEYDEGTVTILGVPSREESVFAATPLTTLVSTGDNETISLVVLKIGYPASSLWHYPEYVAANNYIKKQGTICHDIYPGFPPKRRKD